MGSLKISLLIPQLELKEKQTDKPNETRHQMPKRAWQYIVCPDGIRCCFLLLAVVVERLSISSQRAPGDGQTSQVRREAIGVQTKRLHRLTSL